MDDASQSKTSLSPGKAFSQNTVHEPVFAEDAEHLEEQVGSRLVIKYAHGSHVSLSQGPLTSAAAGPRDTVLACHTFDALLVHLEAGEVDAIDFDASVPVHERRYIIGWAKIFRPHVQCYVDGAHCFAKAPVRSPEVA